MLVMAFLFQLSVMKFICFEGNIYPADKPVLLAANRGFRYGDGLFETMKIVRGNILHETYHYERLLQGLRLLNISHNRFNTTEISRSIIDLCWRNECLQHARVRLAVFRTEHNFASHVIEAVPLDADPNTFHQHGLHVGLYPFARKSVDAFANLKTANYLPYVMADLYAKEKRLDECLLLNVENNICDASKANLFLLVGNEAFTPALHQGCVNGIKRRFVIEELKKMEVVVHQKEITEELLLRADEVFLTNAIIDLRWVKRYKAKTYTNSFTAQFYQSTFSTNYK